jgi:hypothetical protein
LGDGARIVLFVRLFEFRGQRRETYRGRDFQHGVPVRCHVRPARIAGVVKNLQVQLVFQMIR